MNRVHARLHHVAGCSIMHALLHCNATHRISACLHVNTRRLTPPSPRCTTYLRHYSTHLPSDVSELKKKWKVPVLTDLRYQSRPHNFRFHAATVCGVSECLLVLFAASVAFIRRGHVQQWHNCIHVATVAMVPRGMLS